MKTKVIPFPLELVVYQDCPDETTPLGKVIPLKRVDEERIKEILSKINYHMRKLREQKQTETK